MSEIRRKIAVDIDDVLAESTDALRLFVNQRCGIDLTPEHYRVESEYWEYYERIWEAHGIYHPEMLPDFHNTMVTGQADISPIPGAVDGCEKLSKKFDLQPLTSRPPAMQSETEIWLATHFTPVIAKPILLGYGENAAKSKGEYCAENGIDFLIDDNPDHCKSAVAKGITAILFGELGWHINVNKDIIRCKNWGNVEDFFNVQS